MHTPVEPVNGALQEKYSVPMPVSKLEHAFSGASTPHLPLYHEIPREFKDLNGRTVWTRVANDLVLDRSRGVSPDTLKLKPEVDPQAAADHLGKALTDMSRYEHKVAGVAYLLSRWFTEPEAAAT